MRRRGPALARFRKHEYQTAPNDDRVWYVPEPEVLTSRSMCARRNENGLILAVPVIAILEKAKCHVGCVEAGQRHLHTVEYHCTYLYQNAKTSTPSEPPPPQKMTLSHRDVEGDGAHVLDPFKVPRCVLFACTRGQLLTPPKRLERQGCD